MTFAAAGIEPASDLSLELVLATGLRIAAQGWAVLQSMPPAAWLALWAAGSIAFVSVIVSRRRIRRARYHRR